MTDGDSRLAVGLKVLHELRTVPDRHAAIVGACFIEYGLDQLLSKAMHVDGRTPDEIDKHLDKMTFCKKAERAFAIQAISDSIKRDLDTIRGIRNAFAHELLSTSSDNSDELMDFESLKIATLCNDLIQPVQMALTSDPSFFPLACADTTSRWSN